MAAVDPTEHTVEQLKDEIASVDDPDALQEILDAEEDGENRTSAKEAIERRLDEVEADDGNGSGDSDESGGDEGSEQGEQGEQAAEEDLEDTVKTDGEATLIDVRNRVRDVAADLIGRDLDSITAVRKDQEGWRVVVDIIERHSVPDTQDIIGRYEIHLNPQAEIVGYHRIGRLRRGDTEYDEYAP